MKALATAALLGLLLVGCRSTTPPNPPLPETRAEAKAALREMAQHPAEARRPLVVLGGWGDFVWGMGATAETLLATLDGPHAEAAVVQNHAFFGSFDANREKLIAAVDAAYPTDDPAKTVPVDVVGFSMGGLVARYAAMPEDRRGEPARRLNVVRLFTVSHAAPRGADGVDVAAGGARARHAARQRLPRPARHRPARARLRAGRLRPQPGHDRRLAAGGAEGTELNWVPSPWWQRGHADAKKDPRILGDIARRCAAPGAARRRARHEASSFAIRSAVISRCSSAATPASFSGAFRWRRTQATSISSADLPVAQTMKGQPKRSS